jgi:hypothetical protein
MEVWKTEFHFWWDTVTVVIDYITTWLWQFIKKMPHYSVWTMCNTLTYGILVQNIIQYVTNNRLRQSCMCQLLMHRLRWKWQTSHCLLKHKYIMQRLTCHISSLWSTELVLKTSCPYFLSLLNIWQIFLYLPLIKFKMS